jgi:hypothetical protein
MKVRVLDIPKSMENRCSSWYEDSSMCFNLATKLVLQVHLVRGATNSRYSCDRHLEKVVSYMQIGPGSRRPAKVTYEGRVTP